jgi:lipopolysaccharide/colanic/teichoic acid biosynthesis glycosyltransferase
MAVSMRSGHDSSLLRLAPADQAEETVLQASQHLQLLALRRVLAEEAAPVGGTVARAAVKRTFDIVVSAVLLLLALPVILGVAIAIKLDSPGPVFYAARRIGHRGRPLRMYKFRKMGHRAAGPKLTTEGDHRFTRVGEWLAKSKLDELPQLWNVLHGDMSLIGPRPEDPSFVALHAPDFIEILRVRPGITGLSQVAFAEESRILDGDDPTGHYLDRILPQKMGMDRIYAMRYHLRLDISILVWTLIAVVARREVAVHRDTGRMNLRRRPAPAEALSGPATPALALAPAGGQTPVVVEAHGDEAPPIA